MDLLVTLVDSGMIKASQYENWLSKIFFDAKIEMKKQKGSDEKKMEEENKKDDDAEGDYAMTTARYSGSSEHSGALRDYAVLLAPFYEQNINVLRQYGKRKTTKDYGRH